MDVSSLIDLLGLKPHPSEGGYFAETYRSDEAISSSSLPPRYGGDRSFSTAIYFLLTAGTFSVMHRLRSDEVSHFYSGDPVEMLFLYPDGSSAVTILGAELEAGQRPQVVAPKDVWQGCRLLAGGTYALMGTTVAPGFEYDDFEVASREDLIAQYPERADLIAALTRC